MRGDLSGWTVHLRDLRKGMHPMSFPPTDIDWPRVGAIVFDLGNVILDLDNERYGKGWPDDIGASDRDFGTWIAGERLWYRYDTGRIGTDDFVAALTARLDLSAREVVDFYNSILLPGINTQRFDTLRALRGRYPRYVLSNTSPLHIEWVREYVRREGYGTWEDYFEEIVYSYDADARSVKPEPGIYEALERKSAVAPEALLFVDDREENVLAARRRGWQAVHLPVGFAVEGVLSGAPGLELAVGGAA